MVAAEGQVHLVGANRDLLMGEGTKFDVQDDFNPFNRQQRADQGGPRPYAHGSWVGAEWQAEAVVPLRVIANGSNKDVATTRAAIQEMTAAFSAVGATGEIAELRFHLEGDDQEFLMFGRPRGPEPDLATIALGYVYASGAFVAADPRVYSGQLTTVTTGMGVQRGGLVIPARVATTRLRLPDVSGSYASTPNHASLQILGDFSLRIGLDMQSWTDSFQQLVTRYGSAGAISYALNVDGSGFPRVQWSADGTTVLTATASQSLSGVSGFFWLRGDLDVDNGAAGRTSTFFTGPARSGPWTAFGTPVVQAGVTSVFAGSAPLEIGSRGGGTTQTMRGTVDGAEVRNSAGTVVADPDFTARTFGATSFNDATGKTWTVHGTAKLVGSTYKGGVTLPTTIPGRLVGGSITITNTGTTAAPLLLRIDGPAVEPWIRVQRPDGTTQTVRFDLTLADGQWLTVDSISRQALLNDQPSSNMRGRATWDMDEYPILPGTSVIRFGGAEYDPDAELTASARSAWF